MCFIVPFSILIQYIILLIKVNLRAGDLNKIFQSNQKVTLYFYATWCGPCQRLTYSIKKIFHKFKSYYNAIFFIHSRQTLERIVNSRPDITMVKANADERWDLSSAYGITGMPKFKKKAI